jgi:alpha-tubulin suppressor-like RCC1 family protein
LYTAEAATDPNGDEVLYRISAQGKRGIIRQKSLTTFDYQPVVTFAGQDEFRYQACDVSGQCSDEKRVIVNVQAANLSPLFLGFSGPNGTVNATTSTISINEDLTSVNTPTFQLLGQDDENDLGMCSAVYDFNLSAADQAILQKSKITVSGVFPFCQVKFVPEANKFGLVTLNITMTDFNTTANFDYKLNVVNQPDPFVVGAKVVSGIPAGNPPEDNPFEIRFDVEDVDGDLNCTTMVSYTSSATAIVADGQSNAASAQGSGCKLQLNPLPNKNGAVNITITLADAGAPWIQSVNILPTNDAPTISQIADQTTTEDTPIVVRAIELNDVDNTLACPTALSVVSSSNPSLLPTSNVVFDNDEQNAGKCKITLTPSANQFGSSDVVVQVADGPLGNAPTLTTTRGFRLSVTASNDAPTLAGNVALSNDSSQPGMLTTDEGISVVLNNLTLSDVDTNVTCAGSLELAVSSDTNVLPMENVIFSNDPNPSNSGKCRIILTPAANASGTSNLTIRATDGAQATDYYLSLQVNQLNDAPTLSEIPSISTNEDTSVSIGNISITDQESNLACATSLTVTISSNPDLLPINTNNISFITDPQDNTKCRLNLTPAANQNGTSNVTVQVTDGTLTAARTFTLNVNSVNDAPLLQNLPTTAVSALEDNSTTVTFNLSDDTENLVCSNIIPSAINTTLTGSLGLLVAGGSPLTALQPTTTCALTITPPANAHGNAIVYLSIDDGQTAGTTTASFNLTVTAVNDTPTISITELQTPTPNTQEDTPKSVNLTVADADGPLSCTAAYLQANDAAAGNLVQSVTFSGTWPNCVANVVPKPNLNGTTTVDFTVTDRTATSLVAQLQLVIESVDDLPTITLGFSSPQTTPEEAPLAGLSVAVNDPDNPAVNCQNLTISSSTPSLLPSGSISNPSTTQNCPLTLSPALNQVGSTTVTLQLTSDSQTASRSFVLNVTDVNDPPVLQPIQDLFPNDVWHLSTNEDTPLNEVVLNVSDVDTDDVLVCTSALRVVNSSNPNLLSASNISFVGGTSPGSCKMNLTPAANRSGEVTVQLELSDGTDVATESFTLRVVPQDNDAPTMDSIAAQITSEDMAFDISIVVDDPDGYTDNNNVAFSCATYLMALAHDQTKIATPSGVQFSGQFPNCTARVTPVLNANTQTPTLLTFVVTDPTQRTASRTFPITINASNDAPVIQVQTLPSFTEDQSPAPVVNFTITDVDESTGTLACTAATAVDTNDPNDFSQDKLSSVTIGTSGANCTATVNLIANANGAAKFTLRADDGGNGGTGALTDVEEVSFTIAPVNDAPTGTVACTGMASTNLFKTGLNNNSSWSVAGCGGATDVDGDALTYRFELDNDGTSSTISAGFTCPTPLNSTPITNPPHNATISGSFAHNEYGSCRYRLKACDASVCSAASTHALIVSSYQLDVAPPSAPTLSAQCVVSSTSNISASANFNNFDWEGSTNAPGAIVQGPTSISGNSGSAALTTDISSLLLDITTFFANGITKTADTPASRPSVKVVGANLTDSGFIPPASDITTGNIFSAATYTIRRTLEALAVRKGGASGGAATQAEHTHNDGQQPDFNRTTTSCNTCTSTPLVSISAGDEHTCLVEGSGTTKCWGSSSNGRLGIGTNPSLYTTIPTAVVTNNAGTFTHSQVAAGMQFSCLLGSAAQGIKCWGNNQSYQLGRGGSSKTQIDSPDATSVQGIVNPIALSASKTGAHACAITSAGGVYCWGEGGDGQLGNGSTTDRSTAVQVVLSDGTTALPSARSIAVGGSHSCAALSFDNGNTSVTESGIYCWGSNTQGQLGDGTSTNTDKAVAVAVIDTVTPAPNITSGQWFTQVVAGENHTCALRSDGAVFCWGLNSSGQLGDNSQVDKSIPTAVNGLGTGSDVVALSAGKDHTCALKNDHTALCWGDNSFGQLGDGTQFQRLVPVESISAGNSNAVALSAGSNHTCVANFDGTAQCWGQGSKGQLGNNSTTTSDGSANDCDSTSGVADYCSKSPASVQWTAGNTANTNLRPRTCHRYTIP